MSSSSVGSASRGWAWRRCGPRASCRSPGGASQPPAAGARVVDETGHHRVLPLVGAEKRRVVMPPAVAKMLFRLPDAAAVTDNPDPDELQALALRMSNAQPTRFGSVNVQTDVVS